MASSLRRSYNENTKAVWLTLFPVVAGGCLWAGYIGVRNLGQHNDITIKAKGAEPYLQADSPKLISRRTAISTTNKWVDEMGGEPSRKH